MKSDKALQVMAAVALALQAGAASVTASSSVQLPAWVHVIAHAVGATGTTFAMLSASLRQTFFAGPAPSPPAASSPAPPPPPAS